MFSTERLKISKCTWIKCSLNTNLAQCETKYYILKSQLVQLFYLFYLQQSEYGSSMIEFHKLTAVQDI